MSRPPETGSGPSGILVLAKPAGPTSHDMVGLVRRLAGVRRVGHGGTLDPFASGVLPLFLGRATRLAEYHLGDGKAYRATVCFGLGSTTDDLEGELTPAGSAPDRATVDAALSRFRGPIQQTPPAYSAIKVAGRRAYALARAGQAPELKPRTVTIDRIEVLEWDGSDPQRPIATIEVDCSAGTYIRSLARDLGAAVGSAAYLGALVRTASGPFHLDAAHPVDVVREAATAGPDRLAALVLPPDTGLERFPKVVLDEAEVRAVGLGQFIRPHEPLTAVPGADDRFRLVDGQGALVAIAAWRDGRIAPDKVLVDARPDERPAAPPAGQPDA
ncbi:MAG: tRNA pseudouridine(55) synthase TruB [Candidatus Limnocylindrales bacterium]